MSGLRHSAADQKHGNAAMKELALAGFQMPEEEGAAAKSFGLSPMALAVKCWEMGPIDYATQEAWTVQDAAQALSLVASLICGELSELRQPDSDATDLLDITQLTTVARGLIKFTVSELDEVDEQARRAMTPPTPPDEAATAQAQAGEAAVLAGKTGHSYIKSLKHVPDAEQYFKDVLAAKFVAKNTVRMYSMLWGDDELPDVEMDYFTKGTDFWDKTLALPKPLTYDHGQNEATKESTVLGPIQTYGDDDIGRWIEAELDRNHQYRKAVDKLIGKRALGGSSDSAPQYVLREQTGKSFWLKQWPWFATALTPTAAEPRMYDAGLPRWKSIGLGATLAGLAEQSVVPTGDMAEVQRLARELDLISLAI